MDIALIALRLLIQDMSVALNDDIVHENNVLVDFATEADEQKYIDRARALTAGLDDTNE